MKILLLALWILMLMSIIIQYSDVLADLPTGKMIIVFLIFTIVCPAFYVINIATWLLDIILGEGWDEMKGE